MTTNTGNMSKRFDKSKDYASNKLNDQYNNEELNNDFLNWVGNYNNSGYDGDLYNIHKSKEKYFDMKGLGNNLIDKFTENRKTSLNNYLDQKFFGDWLDNYWSSTADDEMINNYINEKYTDAQDQLERAYKRGLLTDTSYYDALNELDVDKSIMYNSGNNVGSNLINQYRDDLSAKETALDEEMGKYSLANYSNFNKNYIDNTVNNTYANQQSLFNNALTAELDALGGFDVSGLIGDARVAAGVGNNQSNELISAIEDTNKKKEQQIGLGNQGMF